MKLICAPKDADVAREPAALRVMLFGPPEVAGDGSAGAALVQEIRRMKLISVPRAWDLLALALSVVSADLAVHRDQSPDGWTREFKLQVAVCDPAFWNAHSRMLARTLEFLTTDRWIVDFVAGGWVPDPIREPILPEENCLLLLSGGLDSLVGAIDLASSGSRPFAVSQIVRGDAGKQKQFAERVGGGIRHIQLNHNARVPDPEKPPTQRARSLTFLAYGVLIATALKRYQEGDRISLYVCENGFISINPPLTDSRIGSLSTRTTHPAFLQSLQQLLEAAQLNVEIKNPYQHMTKGEMLVQCADQSLLRAEAASSTSCGRFQRFGYRHCGRCVPCQVRRAAFVAWGIPDATEYVYEDLGRDDEDHARSDDVRSAAMAIAEVRLEGLDYWLGATLSSSNLGDTANLKDVVKRGLAEIEKLHLRYGVK
jgi:7-cyano-7-deazaguanine synthase in queuosine biosynthesis